MWSAFAFLRRCYAGSGSKGVSQSSRVATLVGRDTPSDVEEFMVGAGGGQWRGTRATQVSPLLNEILKLRGQGYGMVIMEEGRVSGKITMGPTVLVIDDEKDLVELV